MLFVLFFDVQVLSIALVSSLSFSLVLRTCSVVFGLIDYVQIVFFLFLDSFGLSSVFLVVFVRVGCLGSGFCFMLC